MSRRQLATDNRKVEVDWKREISDILRDMNIITDGFSGIIVISFKDGGINYLEKKEVFK
jgi:hypothetical protein